MFQQTTCGVRQNQSGMLQNAVLLHYIKPNIKPDIKPDIKPVVDVFAKTP